MGWADPEERFGVFDHVTAPGKSSHTGYVVRSGDLRADGSVWWPSPYGEETPESIYKRRHAAQARADKLNG